MKWKCSDAEINWEIALTLQFNNQNVNVGKNDSHLKKYGNTSAGDSEGFHFGFEPKKIWKTTVHKSRRSVMQWYIFKLENAAFHVSAFS